MVLAPAAEISRGRVRRNLASLEAGRRLAGDIEGAELELEGRGDDEEERADSNGDVEAEAGWALFKEPSSPEREDGAGKPPSPLVAVGGCGWRTGQRRRGAVREGDRSDEVFFFFLLPWA